MELKPDEVELLRNYRKLSEHEKGYVDAMIDALDRDQKKKNFKVCEGRRSRDK